MYSSRHESIAVESVAGPVLVTSPDVVSIRGVRLPVAELVDQRFFEPGKAEELHRQLLAASPFPHLVLPNVFNPRLLELVIEEFDLLPPSAWADIKSSYENTRRSVLGAKLGPASQLYFDIVNSGWYTEWLSTVIGVPYLLPDPKLFGGGLHESRVGATFAVHRDFTYHRHIGLRNEMVMITYLNKNWQAEWGSALELWDADRKGCVTRVQPEFGHTLIMPHGPASYHGHPHPMHTPDGRPRRSIAAYFYTSPDAGKRDGDQSMSIFLSPRKVDQAKTFVRMLMPPVVWSAVRKLKSR